MRFLVVSIFIAFAVILHHCQDASAKKWDISTPMQPIPGCKCKQWKDRYRCWCPIGGTTTSVATTATTTDATTTSTTTTTTPTDISSTTTATTATPTDTTTTTTATTATPTDTTTTTTATTATPTDTTATPTETTATTTATTATTATPTGTTATTTTTVTQPSCAYPDLHTMCLPASGLFQTTCAVNPTEILSVHNDLRATLPDTGTIPTNMQKMYWDDELAAIAQAWANQCVIGHDTSGNRSMLGLIPSPGQNGAFGASLSWTSAINLWYSEVNDFQYGVGSINDEVIGHFTQMVMSTSVRIGCGCAMCDAPYSQYMFCNYMGPNWSDEQATPYLVGNTQCAACPDTCIEGLCDCDGKYCYNYGTMNVNTCVCS